MRIALSQGSEVVSRPEPVPPAETQPLTAQETEALLKRLAALEDQTGDQQEFRLPPETLPAPRPGETIEQEFPPAETAPPVTQPAAGPLQVLRYSPEGAVDQAPFLSITFDQPMVPLTAHADLAAQDVPVRLSPQPEGHWKWLGTRTLVFQPSFRFPMATEYTVEVPAGTTSATGGKLAQAVRWTFSTPPPKLTASYPPDGPQVRNPLLFAAFDQRIDPAAVLETIQVREGGPANAAAAVRVVPSTGTGGTAAQATVIRQATGRAFATVLATAEEVEKDEAIARLAKETGEGRWLAFRCTELLPYNTHIVIEIGPGTPSAEGPRTTDTVQSFTFLTYGPLQVVEHRCGWDDNCPPMTPWYIRFSNPLDEEAFSEALVQIEPELPGGKLSIVGESLQIEGQSRGRTTYTVLLKAAIADRFGQTLGTDQTVTFAVGSAEPTMYASWENLAVVDPASKPTFSVYSINYNTMRVKAYAVAPEDWPAYLQYLQQANRDTNPPNPPGRLVLDQAVAVKGELDVLTETPIDLSAGLKDGRGHVILIIEPGEPAVPLTNPRDWKPTVRVWVQMTGIGLDAFVDGEKMIAWASSLQNGSSLADAELTLFPGGASARSGTDGTARFTLPAIADKETAAYVVARLGNDSAILPQQVGLWSRGWQYSETADYPRWYVLDDRGMYRPGEEVHVKGWVRMVNLSEGADILTIPGRNTPVTYELLDSRGNELLKGSLTLNALGGFDTAFMLPETMNLGQANMRLHLNYYEYYHGFQVQEFRRPEFEVATTVSEGPYFSQEYAMATVEATYYAGGALPNAEVYWVVTSQTGTYRPPNWDEFTFGIWIPWWRGYSFRRSSWEEAGSQETYPGTTDAAGKHTLRIDFETEDPPQPMSITAEATVMDVNRQAWAARSTILVHPADLYVGLRTQRTFYEKGQPIQVEAIVTDLDGNPVTDRPITVKMVRLDWRYVKGEWIEEEVEEQTCTAGSQAEPVSCTFETPEGGTYRITATIRDAKGRSNLTQMTRWVSGGKQPGATRVEKETVELIPDRQEYQPGDTAEILVQAPFFPAEGMLTLARGGILQTERFRMDESTYTLRIPIDEMYIPNLNVQVELVGETARLNSDGEPDETLPKRPAYAGGSLDLSIPPYSRTLALEVTPKDAELEPGGETSVDVLVQNAAGQPVQGAELVAVVVDEAVLALTNYTLVDPVSIFYQARAAGVNPYYLRQYILLVDPIRLSEEGGRDMVMRAAGKGGEALAMPAMPTAMPAFAEQAMDNGAAAEPINIRTDFNALATFAPSVTTDASGQATVQVKLPDNLTRYRVMVVAVSGEREFGKAESAITARLPLMVRPSAPRFLNFGDEFELPVVVQNQTDEPMVVGVVVRATNVQAGGSTGLRLTVPARDRREVRFPFSTESAGTARFQVAAASGRWADAAEFSLPVYTPATTEAFAVYGTVDEGAIAQPVLAPSDAFTQFGGLDVSTSSTALQALSDAVLYLAAYPFECSEQIASRLLAVAALRDVLSAFQAEGLPEPEELLKAVTQDIETLQGLQNEDGGWPIWQRGRESWPFYSIHATYALVKAREKGFAVDGEKLGSALSYLRSIEDKFKPELSQDVRNTLTSYALYVRSQMGDVDTARARRLVREAGVAKLQPEALGWLLMVLTGDAGSTQEVTDIRKHLGNRVVETAGMANFSTSYREEDGYLLLASDRRADGVLLEALIVNQPESDLIPKIVRGLLAHQKRGKWGNTQENVFILLALDKYFQKYEAQTPDFVARVWLGEQYVAGFDFEGRTTEYQSVRVPMSYLAQQAGEQNLILSKDGTGRVYYRLGITYAPKDLTLEPLEEGFTVLRTYEAVDDPEDVERDENGVWHVRAGARVRIKLTMVAPSRRYHVALTDPLPAGFEAINPELAVSGTIPQATEDSDEPLPRYWWWHWTWYEHQNLRDQRAEAFASLLWEGVHEYSYVARATTPGTFVAPPAKAEEMYSPEVFGRSATEWVVVE